MLLYAPIKALYPCVLCSGYSLLVWLKLVTSWRRFGMSWLVCLELLFYFVNYHWGQFDFGSLVFGLATNFFFCLFVLVVALVKIYCLIDFANNFFFFSWFNNWIWGSFLLTSSLLSIVVPHSVSVLSLSCSLGTFDSVCKGGHRIEAH